MIIDVHAHVYAFPRLYKRNSPEQMFMSAVQQVRRMDEKGIDRAVILPLNSAEGPAERQSIGEVLYICEQYPDRFIPFCDIDPRRADLSTQEDFDAMLEQHRDLGCRGFGEFTARVPFDDPRVLMLLSACARVEFPVTFHTVTPEVRGYGVLDDPGFPRFEQALRRLPELKFFGHSAAFWSEISGELEPGAKNGYPKGPVKPGGALVRLLRTYPNLNGDLSAGSGFNALTRDPGFAYEFIDEFQDRLMLGLDHTDVTHDFQHIEWLSAARDEGHITSEILEKILWGNANRLIGLGLA
jgi:uncharacterized protein